MSYAEVTKDNIPAGEMPEPSQELLDGAFHGEDDAGNSTKINVLPAEPASDSSPSDEKDWDQAKAEAEKDWQNTKKEWDDTKDEAAKKVNKAADAAEKKAKDVKKRAKAEYEEAETAVSALWIKTKDILLRPGTMGGLMGIVNVGLLGSMGYWAYQNRDRTWDRRNVSAAVVGTLALFGAEGFLADSYLETPEGRAEAERAKKEGSRLYLKAKEVILRPNVFGGLAGLLNVGVLGTVGYFAYRDWNRPWDHRVVAGVTAGLLALSGIEGWLGTTYVKEELPKH